MKLTLGEALDMAKALPTLLDKEIPVRPAYWLGRAVDQINSKLKAFEAVRFKLIEKYGEKDSDGKLINEDGQYKIADTDGFNKEYSDIIGEEIEIEHNQISVEDLGDIKIASSAMIGLGKLLKDSVEE